jgi:hypothetical protein
VLAAVKMLKMLKMLKISRGTRECIRGGGGAPGPGAAGEVGLVGADAFSLLGGVEGAAGDAGLASLAHYVVGWARAGGESGAQPFAGFANGRPGLFLLIRGTEEVNGTQRALTLPDDAGGAGAGILLEAEDEGGGQEGEVRFGGGEDAAVGSGGIGGEEEGAAGGADETDAAATAVEGACGAGLVEVTDGDDGGAGALGDDFEAGEGAADSLIGGAEARREESGEGVDDDEGGVDMADDVFEDGGVVRDDEEGVVGFLAGDGGGGDHAGRIAAGGVEARANGVDQIVFGGDQENGAGSVGLAIGEGLTAAHASGELAEESGLADARVAVKERDLAGGEAAKGEPVNGLGGHGLQADEVGKGIALVFLANAVL